MKKPESSFDPNINYAKYLELRFYDFKSDYTNNPLVPVYPVDKSEINLPDYSYTNVNLDACNKLLASCQNLTDRKPVNCCKIFNYSKKLICGTTAGNLIIYEIYPHTINFINKISGHQSSVRAIQFTKSEDVLLTGDSAGNIIYFDGQIDQKSKIKAHNDKEAVTDISFSISDTKFITSSDDKTAKIFDLNTGMEELVFDEHGSDVKSCDWNPYKSLVCTGGKDQLLKIWDPLSKKTISTLHPHKNTINRLRFNKNGNWLLSASKDHSVKVTDIRVMKEIQIFKGHEMEVNTVSWHPNREDMFCSAGADGNLIHWMVGQNKSLIMKTAHDKEVFDLCYSQSGNILASSSNDTTVRFWTRKYELY